MQNTEKRVRPRQLTCSMKLQGCLRHQATEPLRRDGTGLKLQNVFTECGCTRGRRDVEDATLSFTPVHRAEVLSFPKILDFGVDQPDVGVSVERVCLHHADEGFVFRRSAKLSLVRLDPGHRADRLCPVNTSDRQPHDGTTNMTNIHTEISV